VRPEVPRVELHVPLQHDVEEHIAPPLPRRRPAAARRVEAKRVFSDLSPRDTRVINP
jgi:hypothetical protein